VWCHPITNTPTDKQEGIAPYDDTLQGKARQIKNDKDTNEPIDSQSTLGHKTRQADRIDRHTRQAGRQTARRPFRQVSISLPFMSL